MDIDKFLKSQTFKTGTFVLLVIFTLLFVFKVGVLHGYKKAQFLNKFDNSNSWSIGSNYFKHQKFMHSKGAFYRSTHDIRALEDLLLKKHFFAIQKIASPVVDRDISPVEN